MITKSEEEKAKEFRHFIEVEVLKIIQDLINKENYDLERIRKISQLTLDLIQPGMSLEELYQKAVKLDDQYSELAPPCL